MTFNFTDNSYKYFIVLRKSSDIFAVFSSNLDFMDGLSCPQYQTSPLRAMLIRADKWRDGRKDIMNVLGIFSEYANAPNNNDSKQYRHNFNKSFPLA
jgi:hypothetical protein